MALGKRTGRGVFLATIVVTLAAILFAGKSTTVFDDSVLRHLAQAYRQRVFQIREEKFGAKAATTRNSSSSLTAPLDGIVILVTGSTSGIGRSLVLWAFREGATIVAMGRSETKLEMLRDELVKGQRIPDNAQEFRLPEVSKPAVSNESSSGALEDAGGDKESSPRRFFPIVADMSDLASVSSAVDVIKNDLSLAMIRQIDVVVCNAGTWQSSDAAASFAYSKQGHELTFGVNYLSHFLLAEKLMHTRIASSISDSDEIDGNEQQYILSPTTSRIVQVSSSLHMGVNGKALSVVTNEELNLKEETKRDSVVGSINDMSYAPLASRTSSYHGALQGGPILRYLEYFFRSQRQYANSKLAQILQARISNRKFFSYFENRAINSANRVFVPFVTACPGWVGTKILRSKIQKESWRERFFHAVSHDVDGYGLSSILKAMFDPLILDLTNEDNNNIIVSKQYDSALENFDYFPNFGGLLAWTASVSEHLVVFLEWILTDIHGIAKYTRDILSTLGYVITLMIQSFFKTSDVMVKRNRPGEISKELFRYSSSISSYNRTLQHELYEWSLEAVAEYL